MRAMLGFLLAMSLSQEPPQHKVPLPSANQMAWHVRQYYAFVHFGPNTFSGNEWGIGDEDPSAFDPTALDCRQWARTFKEAGMSGVIITAKHHDGFALWPSKLTTHSVKASKWRGGGGDVLKEMSAACKEYGLWMGVYLSPWDRNHPAYGTDAYNDVFVGMLREVLTQYGDIKEVWFDGANGEGPNGKRQVYDWVRYEATVREYAPNAVIFGDGGDVRWVGNESGFVGETNWNFLPSGHWPGDQSIYDKLFEGDPGGDKYSPAECDVSIRPGWFWRASENSRVKSLTELKEIYYRSIGHGANLLLNVPPDTRGLIHENDVAALMKFKKWQDKTLDTNLAKTAMIDGSFRSRDPKFSPSKLNDDSLETHWMAGEGQKQATLFITFKVPTIVDHLALGETLAFGQNIAKFRIFGGTGVGDADLIAEGTTIGFRRIIKIAARRYTHFTILIEARGIMENIGLTFFEALLAPPGVAILGESDFMGEQIIELRPDNLLARVRYTLDGSDPDESSMQYGEAITLVRSCTLRAKAFFEGKETIEPAVMDFKKYEVGDLLPATVFIKAPETGLAYKYFEQGWQTLDQMKEAVETQSGVSDGLNLGVRRRDEHFGLQFDGAIVAPKDGVYTYDLASDDGSRLWIDDKLIIDNDGLHGMQSKRGVVGLREGYHRVRIEYFNAGGGMGLQLSWKRSGFEMREMLASEFLH